MGLDHSPTVEAGCNLVAGAVVEEGGCKLPVGCNFPVEGGCNWPGWSTRSVGETLVETSLGNDNGRTDNMHNNSKPRWK